MRSITRSLALAFALVASLLVQDPAQSKDLPQAIRGVTVPPGFAASVFAATPMVPTTITWGPVTDTSVSPLRHDHGSLLYVGGVAGNPISCNGCGQVIAYTDESGPSTTVATGLNAVLGIAFGPDNTLYAADNLNNTGRVVALRDADANGTFETSRVVLKNIPNGRHQTNGLAFGPDGKIYLANGNATDDGIECGPPLGPEEPVELPPPLDEIYEETFRDKSCATPEVEPWTGSIIRVDPAWNNVDLRADVRVDADPFYAADGMDDEGVLVAQGFRNIYDLDFRPDAENDLWTPMNGPDDPSGSEPIYGLPIDDEQVVGTDPETDEPIYGPVIEDAGFPSCVYDPHENPFPSPNFGGHEHIGNPEPGNSSAEVIARYGECPVATVYRPRAVLKDGHEGTSGLAFERGGQFPPQYDGDLFIAEWGSLWNLNGGQVTGHKIIVLDVQADGTVAGRQRDFMTTPLPIDLTFGPDGRLYVADMTGQIYVAEHVSGAATPDTVPVSVTNGQFVPPVVTVTRGQAVRWCNSDEAAHNVRAIQAVKMVDPTGNEKPNQDGAEINSPGNLAKGQCHTYRFGDRAGVWSYESNVAADALTMKGTVVVLPVER